MTSHFALPLVLLAACAVVLIGAIAWIAWTQGPEAAGENVAIWFLAHAIPTAIAAVSALSMPPDRPSTTLSKPFFRT